MIELYEVLAIHQILISKFGGITGVRDFAMLQSSIERPFSGMNEEEFYPTIAEKASALIESIIKNHPFVDGNKRIGYVTMRLFLQRNGVDIIASQDEKYEFVINIVSGIFSFEDICLWVKEHLRK